MPKKSWRDKKTGARIALKTGSNSGGTYSSTSKTPRSINELIERNPLIGRLTQQLSAQRSWTEWLRQSLPADVAPHIVYAVPRQGELVVFADTSAWSVRLRYAAAGLSVAIRQRDPTIIRTSVRVRPSSEPQALSDNAISKHPSK